MKTALINGIILDGTENMVPVSGKTIIIDKENIVAIKETGKADLKDCKVIDLKGQYILPGLINLHVHTAGTGKPIKKQMDLPKLCKLILSSKITRAVGKKIIANNMYTTLMSGTTTIRAVGGIGDLDSKVRNEINSGKRIGPRMLVADNAISVEGGHMTGSFSTAVHSPEEAADLVEKTAKAKPDLIKLMITGGVLDSEEVGKPGKLLMPKEYVKAACKKAHELGLKVAAHTEGPEGVKVALENGVDTIEHGSQVTDELINLFKETKASHVLTISPALPFALRMPGILGMSEVAVINSQALMEGMVKMARENIKNGIKVGLGTDASCTYSLQSGMWRELLYFVKYCQVTPGFAIHTATEINAQIAGISDITGTIKAGKSADLIVVKDNPLENLRTLSQVTTVIMKGKVYSNPNPTKYPEVESALDNIL